MNVYETLFVAAGADAGFLLRLLPNVLYYGGLVPAVAWAAPIADKPGAGLLTPNGS